jgi:L-lysine 6-oxidase
MTLSIHPSVGVARLGNTPTSNTQCLGPLKIGGLPIEKDSGQPINDFKDTTGRIRRQGQLFRLFNGDIELTIDDPHVESLEWTVHLANKKSSVVRL